MSEILWGNDTLAAAEQVFGPQVHNVNGRTFRSLNRYIQHALAVWHSRYEMNADQSRYADEVLSWAIWEGQRAADRKGLSPWACVNRQINFLVNHERVHDGFTRRSALIDVRQQLEEALA